MSRRDLHVEVSKAEKVPDPRPGATRTELLLDPPPRGARRVIGIALNLAEDTLVTIEGRARWLRRPDPPDPPEDPGALQPVSLVVVGRWWLRRPKPTTLVADVETFNPGGYL